MSRRFRFLISAAAVLPALAQSPISSTLSRDASGAVTYQTRFRFEPKPFEQPPVTGAPYSATEVSVQNSKEHVARRIARDLAGRVRVERQLPISPRGGEEIPLVEITDPVAGFHYTLDLQNRIAYRIAREPVQRVSTRASAPSAPTATMNAQGKSQVSGSGLVSAPPAPAEIPQAVVAMLPPGQRKQIGPEASPLGKRMIQGVEAEGLGFTGVIATSSGLDPKPLQIHWEQWTSPELKIVLISKVEDAVNGERIVMLKDLRRLDPDPALFQVPADFRIQPVDLAFEMPFVISR
jgi:hypothetical protein